MYATPRLEKKNGFVDRGKNQQTKNIFKGEAQVRSLSLPNGDLRPVIEEGYITLHKNNILSGNLNWKSYFPDNLILLAVIHPKVLK